METAGIEPVNQVMENLRAARVPRSPRAHENPVGGGQERVPWKGVAGEERVEERGWAYRRRQPEGTVLYEAVKDNLATLLAEAREVGRGLPRYVERDFAWYLECAATEHAVRWHWSVCHERRMAASPTA